MNYQGITLHSLPSKVYAKVLERGVQSMVEPETEEEQSGFGTWEFVQPVHVFCGFHHNPSIVVTRDPCQKAKLLI